MPLSRGCVQRSVHGGASCEGKKEGEREGDLWQMRRVSSDGRLSPSTSIVPLLHGKGRLGTQCHDDTASDFSLPQRHD